MSSKTQVIIKINPLVFLHMPSLICLHQTSLFIFFIIQQHVATSHPLLYSKQTPIFLSLYTIFLCSDYTKSIYELSDQQDCRTISETLITIKRSKQRHRSAIPQKSLKQIPYLLTVIQIRNGSMMSLYQNVKDQLKEQGNKGKEEEKKGNSDMIMANILEFKWEMVKKAKDLQKKNDKVYLQKVYREFARLKYKKYKLKYPRLKQSELVEKILKEWEELDVPAKKNLGEEFIERGGSQFLAISSSSSSKGKKDKPKAKPQPQQSSSKNLSKGKKSSPKVREISGGKGSEKRDFMDSSDFKRSQDGNKQKKKDKSTPDKDRSSSSLKYLEKTKRIAKRKEENLKKRNQYLNFSKYYYNKLSSEHPRWSKPQVQSIVRLLWKRKEMSDKKQRRIRRSESLSGRQLYRRKKISEGFLQEQIKLMWKSLPHESKLYWDILGGKKKIRHSEKATTTHVKKVLNAGATTSDRKSATSFSWMEQNMA